MTNRVVPPLGMDDPLSSPTKALPHDERVRIAQLQALFEMVTVGVVGAALAAATLVATLRFLDAIDDPVGLAWALYIAGCAAAHLALRRAFLRVSPTAAWRGWATGFTCICLAEGIGWGWASVGLATQGRFDAKLMAVVVVLGLAAGSIPIFGPYLPAFLAFFLPTTVPFAIAILEPASSQERAAEILMSLFVVAVGSVGVRHSRAIQDMIGLRIRTEELAADLRYQKDTAERANMAKSAFLAAASHDLRQPVHALGLFVAALAGVAMPAEGRRLVEQIQASTDALAGLFTALLDISRLDAGIVQVHRRPFALQGLLDRICLDYAADASAKGITLTCRPSNATVTSDPLLVERILRNLVSNAVRHTGRGRILVGCRPRGDRVAVQVWDTGVGIPLAQQDRVFEEYFQLGNPERDREKGLGLGLAIVRRLGLLLECPVTLRSEPGRGSCFEILMPRSSSGAGPEAAPAEPETGVAATGLIIVVDNEAAIRDAMSGLLTGWGHSVITAASGDEAITKLRVCPDRPQVIIADYRLTGGESGIDVIERLRSEFNDDDMPAMLITGDTSAERLSQAHGSGLALLYKPVSNSRLRAAIINLTLAADRAGTPPDRTG